MEDHGRTCLECAIHQLPSKCATMAKRDIVCHMKDIWEKRTELWESDLESDAYTNTDTDTDKNFNGKYYIVCNICGKNTDKM